MDWGLAKSITTWPRPDASQRIVAGVLIHARSGSEVAEGLFAKDASSPRPVLYAFASFSTWRAVNRSPRMRAVSARC